MEVGKFISFRGIRGQIKYIGEIQNKSGKFVGIELEKPVGKSNGTIKGVRYFECREKHGIIARIEEITKICKLIPDGVPKSQSQILTPQIEALEIEHKSKKEQKVEIHENDKKEIVKETKPRIIQKERSEDQLPLISPSPSSIPISQSCTNLIGSPELERLSKFKKAESELLQKIKAYEDKTKALEKSLAQKEEDNEKKIKQATDELEKAYIKKQIETETLLLEKENEGLEEIRKVRSLAEAADERAAAHKISLLEQVNKAHLAYQEGLDQLLNAQKVNLSVVMQAIENTKKRITRTVNHAKGREAIIKQLNAEKQQKEAYLTKRKPDWKDLSVIKMKFDEANKKRMEEERKENITEVDSKVDMDFISEIGDEQPLIMLAMYVLLFKRKAECICKQSKLREREKLEKLIHTFDTLVLTLSGYLENTGAVQDLIKELQLIITRLDKNERLDIDILRIQKMIQSLTSIPLEKTVTSHHYYYLASITDEEEDEYFDYIDAAETLKKIIHPILLPEEDQDDDECELSFILANIAPEGFVDFQDICTDINIDLAYLYNFQGSKSSISMRRESKRRQQEKERLREKVRKAEHERDILCDKRNDLMNAVKKIKA